MTPATEYEEKRTATAQIFKDLALEMLELVAVDLARPLPDSLDRTTSASRLRADKQSAELWISGPGNRGVLPFALCCDALNVPVEALRAALLARPSHLLAEIRSSMERATGSAKLPNDADVVPDDIEPRSRSPFSRPR